MAILLKDICLEAAEINFVCGCDNCNCAEVFAEYVSEGKWNNKIVVASSVQLIRLRSTCFRRQNGRNAFEKLKAVIEETS